MEKSNQVKGRKKEKYELMQQEIRRNKKLKEENTQKTKMEKLNGSKLMRNKLKNLLVKIKTSACSLSFVSYSNLN